jgi:translocation and assembly module TamB
VKRLGAILLVTVLAGLLALAAGLAWLAGTGAGARWLLETVSRQGALTISAQRVEGRLADRLRLEGVRIAGPQQRVELERLDLSWKPLLLLTGTLGLQELSLQGVRIHDLTPPSAEPLSLAWPRLPAAASLLDVCVARLRLDRLSYRRAAGPAQEFGPLTTAMDWRDGRLSLRELDLTTPDARIAGTVSAGFARPSLESDLTVALPRPLAGMRRFTLSTRLLPGTSPEQVAGKITLQGAGETAGREQRLDLAGMLGVTRTGFNLRDLRLTRPGQSGRITGSAGLDLAGKDPQVTLQVRVADLNLEHDAHLATALSGHLTLSGSLESYRGRFELSNRDAGWKGVRLAADYRGSRSGVKLTGLNGVLLDGTLQGDLEADWGRRGERLSLRGELRGRGINPARIAPDWQGSANFDLTGSVTRTGQGPLQGKVSALLRESRLHGQPLTGELKGDFSGSDLHIARLLLRGRGFDLSGSGALASRLDLSARISDLSRLVPGTAGELQATGWLRRRDGRLGGALTGQGRRLAYGGVSAASARVDARLEEAPAYPLHLALDLTGVEYGHLRSDSVTLRGDGTLADHTLQAGLRANGNEAHLGLAGRYAQGAWQGTVTRLSGRDGIGPWSLAAPAALTVADGRISLAPLALSGAAGERVELAGEWTRQPLGGRLRAEWERLNLARANAWLQGMQVAGSSSGAIRAELPSPERLNLTGTASLQGTVSADGHKLVVRRGGLTLNGGPQGLQGTVELLLADGSSVRGRVASTAPPRPALPETADFSAEWSLPDLSLLEPWLPPGKLQGQLSGQLDGRILPGQRIEMKGRSSLSRARITMKKAEGELDFNLRTAALSFDWRGRELNTDIDLALADYGQARARLRLPLPARLPAAFDPQGKLSGVITGKVREKGLLTALFPGMLQESHGELSADLRVGGTWGEPRFEGLLQLAGAGAYLPASGIRVRDLQLTAHLEKDLIRIDSFRAASGPGHLEGNGLLRLKGWQPAGYSGRISGENFQILDLPEIEVRSSPRLTFEGTPEKLSVQGEVRLPLLRITAPPLRAPIGPSKDVIVEGRQATPEKSARLAVDAQIRLVLGDRVLVKMSGIDAQLGGAMDLTLQGLDKITSSGEIRVVKGRYQTYGVTLDIARGRLYYGGGPLNQPTLDILALRTAGEVKAGVTIGGTLQTPVTKLYSEPPMPDVDILAYVVLGHPLGSSGEQAGLLAQAAGALLSAGQSASLQDQIKSRLGLSTLELQTAPGATTGYMGYKPMTSTPPGSSPAAAQPGLAQTMVTVGKYLTPQLYVSYGRSLFTNDNLFLLRYDITRRWQVETQTGQTSGLDVYYKIEFN